MTGRRPRITVCGLGPGGEHDVTGGTLRALASAERVFLRTSRHPTANLAGSAESFDHIYDRADQLDSVYRAIADALVAAAESSSGVVYAVPGSPLVLERSVQYLRADGRIDIDLVPAISFLDSAWARLGIDPVESGVRLVDGHTFARDAAGERGPLLVAHTHASWVLSDIKLAIDAGPEQRAIVLQHLGTPEERIVEVAWPDLDRVIDADHLTSLYLPEVTAPVARELQRSVELIHRLRQDCPWDAEQTHGSLRKYLIEEAHEVLEALDQLDGGVAANGGSNAYADLEEELGDLWFQILFHSELATEAGEFTIADVARTMHDKLVSRHPHVFGEVEAADSAQVVSNWEQIKQAEKQRASIMDGIPSSLPALLLAEKVLKKADRAGLPADSAWLAAGLGLDNRTSEEALGRHLLAVVESARRADLDPESALRQAVLAARDRYQAAEAAGATDNLWIAG